MIPKVKSTMKEEMAALTDYLTVKTTKTAHTRSMRALTVFSTQPFFYPCIKT